MKRVMRAKHISMRTRSIMHTLSVMVLSFMLFTAMAVSNEAAVMKGEASGGWANFKTAMTNFFYNGLGGDGAKAIGMVIAVIGVLVAAISFVMHKMNPQSRMPSWFVCLIIALIGTLLFSGVGPVLDIIKWFRDTVLGWFGFNGQSFGSYA